MMTTIHANNSDSLAVCIQQAREQIHTLQSDNEALRTEVTALKETVTAQNHMIDSVSTESALLNHSLMALADSLNINISSTRQQIQSHTQQLSETITQKSQTGLLLIVCIASFILVVALVFAWLMHKRKNEVETLSAQADKLNQEIVNRLSIEMNDMQAISKQLSALSSVTGSSNSDTEQALIKTLADRITFMEITLFKMDSSVRGHKQLSRSIKQMKDNLLANGYELVDMLGKDYNDGMKVIANFVQDDELPVGKQIITGIIKPQINYKGKMIQSAQITVSQN